VKRPDLGWITIKCSSMSHPTCCTERAVNCVFTQSKL